MKTYHSPRDVLTRVRGLLAGNKPTSHGPSVLGRTVELLCKDRPYSSAAFYLVIEDRPVLRAFSGPEAQRSGFALASGGVSTAARTGNIVAATVGGVAELCVPLRTPTRVLGVLAARSRGPWFRGEDRVLLKVVAARLSRFLSSTGKYLTRKARQAARGTAARRPERGYDPASEKVSATPHVVRRAAAGEKSYR